MGDADYKWGNLVIQCGQNTGPGRGGVAYEGGGGSRDQILGGLRCQDKELRRQSRESRKPLKVVIMAVISPGTLTCSDNLT